MTAVREPAIVQEFKDESPDEAIQSEMHPWALSNYLDKYAWKDENGDPTEVWPDTAARVTRHVLGALNYTDRDPEYRRIQNLISARKFMPGGRYLYASGREIHQTQNCTLYEVEDNREAWGHLVQRAIMALSLGSGIGVVYNKIRPRGTPTKRTGGTASGPVSLMRMVNEVAREVKAGSRRSAIWAGLIWTHPDVWEFMETKDWSDAIHAEKEKDFNFAAPLDMTNISIILDDEFFEAYRDESHEKHKLAHDVYWGAVRHMLRHGEPGFSIDIGENAGEHLRNACTEITSRDDNDICNLGSLNMANFESLDDFRDAVWHSTLFLLAGTVYSDVPHEEIRKTRAKNRRLGLGLMGIHEWLLKRGYGYEFNDELHEWFAAYEGMSDAAAKWFATKHDLSVPVGVRALAPNGTIAAVAGPTTSGVENLFAVAMKRRYLGDDNIWYYQYVISPVADRLIREEGIDPAAIETAETLGYNYERSLRFRATAQEYIDQGISSTLNLPEVWTDDSDVIPFGETLLEYLPRMRGFTAYPDGARAGQPLTHVPYKEAVGREGQVFEEHDSCIGGSCGI